MVPNDPSILLSMPLFNLLPNHVSAFFMTQIVWQKWRYVTSGGQKNGCGFCFSQITNSRGCQSPRHKQPNGKAHVESNRDLLQIAKNWDFQPNSCVNDQVGSKSSRPSQAFRWLQPRQELDCNFMRDYEPEISS